jgi:tetratricopeptide (TPR) repeat protein
VLPPTDRFDCLIRILGATPAEQGALATARDRVEEQRRRTLPTGATVTDTPVPRQLPADVPAFVGRADALAELDALAVHTGRFEPMVICVVAGTAGVGKTALALRWAHRVADRFPDGQLYLDLHGYDAQRPLSASDALAALLRCLGMDATDLPADLAERSACYRTLLAGRRTLVVLDNAHTVDQVRPLLPGTGSCLVVVTSRDDLAGLVARDGARRIDLDPLSPADALTLLSTLIGERVTADPTATATLARCCALLPLALRIAAELAITHPAMSIAELLADLRDEQRRLDAFDASGDPRTAVRSVFSWSYQKLSPAAATAFGLAGLHPGPDLDPYVVAALSGFALGPAQSVVDELYRAHLIEAAGRGTATPTGFAMHELLRAYAVERANLTMDADLRHAARTRLFDYFLTTAAAAAQTLFPHDQWSRIDVLPTSTPIPPVSDPARAQAFLDLQLPNLVAVTGYAAANGWEHHGVGLSQALWRYLEVGGHYQEALAVHTSAAQARSSDAAVLTNLGSIYWWLGDFTQARTYFELSLAGHRAADELGGQARALSRLGSVHERLGEYPRALSYLEDALELCRQSGNHHGEGAQLVNLGALHRRLGHHEQAAHLEVRAAEVFADLGDLRLQGYALGNLGAVYSLLGRHDEALTHLTQALENCRACADRGGEGAALTTMGAVYTRMRCHQEALDHLHRGLAISRETGDRSLEIETLNFLGHALLALAQPEAALARHQAALALSETTGDRYEHARAQDGAARALQRTGLTEQAGQLWRQAAATFTALGVPEADEVAAQLAAARSAGNPVDRDVVRDSGGDSRRDPADA